MIVHSDGMGRGFRGRWRCARRKHPLVAIICTGTYADGEKVSGQTSFHCACGKRVKVTDL